MGVGTDLVEVARLGDALSRHPGFARRLFTPSEIAYCDRHRDPVPRYAARFAAKEAVLKALGTGLGRGMRWQDVEIVAGPNRRPLVRLHGEVAAVAQRQGVAEVEVSLSHDGAYALAFAVTRCRSSTDAEHGAPPDSGAAAGGG